MAYEIPKNLKYDEKILFNLNIWQALWVGSFGFLVWVIFIKTNLIFEVKIISCLFLALLGIGFAFFGLKKHLLTLGGYLFGQRQAGYFDKALDRFLEIKKIENNTVTLSNGVTIAVLQVRPINFHILSAKQQQAIVSVFKDFLNSLDFPIQIVMRTVNLSLEDYLNALEITVKKQRKEKLLKQYTDFKEFITSFVEENSVKNRLFYVVVPNDKNAPQNQLDIRAKLCMEKLANSNLVTKRLSTQELVSLLSGYFEGFIEQAGEYQSIITLLEKQNVVPKENQSAGQQKSPM